MRRISKSSQYFSASRAVDAGEDVSIVERLDTTIENINRSFKNFMRRVESSFSYSVPFRLTTEQLGDATGAFLDLSTPAKRRNFAKQDKQNGVRIVEDYNEFLEAIRDLKGEGNVLTFVVPNLENARKVRVKEIQEFFQALNAWSSEDFSEEMAELSGEEDDDFDIDSIADMDDDYARNFQYRNNLEEMEYSVDDEGDFVYKSRIW